VSQREERLESLAVALLSAEGIKFERVPKMLSCGCETCTALIAMYQEVAHIIDARPKGTRAN